MQLIALRPQLPDLLDYRLLGRMVDESGRPVYDVAGFFVPDLSIGLSCLLDHAFELLAMIACTASRHCGVRHAKPCVCYTAATCGQSRSHSVFRRLTAESHVVPFVYVVRLLTAIRDGTT